jgi:hypothetical protein
MDLISVLTIGVKAPMPEGPEGPSPPLPRLDVMGTEGARLEPTGLLKPLQKLRNGFAIRGGAVRSARMQT